MCMWDSVAVAVYAAKIKDRPAAWVSEKKSKQKAKEETSREISLAGKRAFW